MPVRIASVPADHVYVRHLTDPVEPDDIVRLPDPPVRGAPARQWWPHPMLEASWVAAHAADFDVLHIHFGYDDRTPAQLARLAAELRAHGKTLIVTVHDLRNPHHREPAAHDAALDVLMGAADAVLTLTEGAAAVIARRWARDAVVVAHPHVVDPDLIAAPRPPHAGFVVGLHAKSLRANSDPVPVARTLAATVATLPGARLQVDAHNDERGRSVAAALRGIDVRVHPPFSDDALWGYLLGLDVSVLPYRFGTHSGWLEACHDLGTTVVAPDCGFYAQQAPCLTYEIDDPGSLDEAVRRAYRERPVWRADPAGRLRQRRRIAATHAGIYRAVLAGAR
jgi:hypothetical protein